MSTLRIVHAVCSDGFAGVERHVASLARMQAEAGLDVTVVGGDGARMQAELGIARWRPGVTVSQVVGQLLRLSHVDLIHAHMTAAETAGAITAPLLRARLIATRHFAQERGSSLAGRLAAPVISWRLSGQIAIGHLVAEYAGGQCRIIYAGTPDVAAHVGADDRERTVLVLQRLEPEKRTDLALHAWAYAGVAEQGWQLLVAGGGSQADSLRVLADRLEIAGSCRFLGPQSDPAPLLQHAAILLAPCPHDGLGLSVLEAMAAGLPVVAAAGGGHLETIGSYPQAALYEPCDVEQAGKLLRDLADNPTARDAYGSALRHLQRSKFSIRQQHEQTLALYHEVCR